MRGACCSTATLLRLPEPPLLLPLLSVFKNVEMITLCSAFNCQTTSGSSSWERTCWSPRVSLGPEVVVGGGVEELLVGAFGFQALLQECLVQRGGGLPRAAQADGPAPTLLSLLSVPGLLPQLVTHSALRSLSTLCFSCLQRERSRWCGPHQAPGLGCRCSSQAWR